MPKLDLSRTAVLSPEERAEFKDAEALLDEVRKRAESLGLVSYPKPETKPPNLADIDVADMPNNQLGQLYSQYTAHAQYMYGETTKVGVCYKLAVANLKQIEAKLKARLFAQEVPKAEVPALVKNDAFRTEYEHEVLKLFVWKEIMEAHYKAFDKQATALSRIIELRKLEFEMSMRDHNIQHYRKDRAGRPARDFRRE